MNLLMQTNIGGTILIDLRSDTITHPTKEMRQAMFDAKVGDDVYREDPTVNELEKMGASILGKEAGLFVTSGTQGNLISVMSQTTPGDEVILEEGSHLFNSETGSLSFIAGVQGRTIKGKNGKMAIEDIKNAIRDEDIHNPKTTLISIENSHAQSGGRVATIDYMKKVYRLAQENNISVHLDGSRIFNAAIRLNVDVDVIAQYADTIQFCLSKGLSAPMGSLVVGSKDVINRARKWRKALGGGTRQSGIVAAAGIVGLEKMGERLVEDHKNALILANGLVKHACFALDISDVETNIVIVSTKKLGLSSKEFIQRLDQLGVKASPVGAYQVRFVTHREVKRFCIEKTIEVVKKVVENAEEMKV